MFSESIIGYVLSGDTTDLLHLRDHIKLEITCREQKTTNPMLNPNVVNELASSETGDIRELINCLNRELAHRDSGAISRQSKPPTLFPTQPVPIKPDLSNVPTDALQDSVNRFCTELRRRGSDTRPPQNKELQEKDASGHPIRFVTPLDRIEQIEDQFVERVTRLRNILNLLPKNFSNKDHATVIEMAEKFLKD